MKAERNSHDWRRWRDAAFATCTVWLVLQNMILLALLAWGRPGPAFAAGTAVARAALSWGGPLTALALAVAMGFGLGARLVHTPPAPRGPGGHAPAGVAGGGR